MSHIPHIHRRTTAVIRAAATLHVSAGTAWLAFCVGGFTALCWLVRGFVTDDAWISVRYAENIAEGHGLVWNPGGPPAEGFSNPALVAAEALAHLAGLSAIGAARAIGVGSGIALLVIVHRWAPAVVGRGAARVTLALIAFYPPLALWSVGGLETMPAALALTSGALLLARRERTNATALRAGAVMAVLPWLRPEGLAVVLALVAAAEAGSLLRHTERRDAFVRVAAAAAVPLASQAALEAFRLIAYGHWLPNSVIYKSGSDQGLAVLEKFVEPTRPVLLAAAIGLAMSRGRQWLLAVPPAVYALGSVGMLDSVNAFSRFLLPVWPPLALLAGLGIARLARRVPTRRIAPVTAVAVAVLLLVITPDAQVEPVRAFSARYASCSERPRAEAAEWLRANTPPTATFSVSDAGLLPARAGGRAAVDQLMLNEPLIQGTGPLPSVDRARIVLARRPDVIVLVSKRPDRLVPRYYTDGSLTRQRGFRRYRLAHVANGGPERCEYHLFVYWRKPTQQQLVAQARSVVGRLPDPGPAGPSVR